MAASSFEEKGIEKSVDRESGHTLLQSIVLTLESPWKASRQGQRKGGTGSRDPAGVFAMDVLFRSKSG